MCRLHHKGCPSPKRGCKVRQNVDEKVSSKVRRPCNSWVPVAILWCELESRCAESTTRGRRHKVEVAKVARASKKN